MSDILTEILKRRDDTIADLEAKIAVHSLTTEQFVRLECFKGCMAAAPDDAGDLDIQNFVSSMTDYVLTGDKRNG